jgi:hypothetical protein
VGGPILPPPLQQSLLDLERALLKLLGR